MHIQRYYDQNKYQGFAQDLTKGTDQTEVLISQPEQDSDHSQPQIFNNAPEGEQAEEGEDPDPLIQDEKYEDIHEVERAFEERDVTTEYEEDQ